MTKTSLNQTRLNIITVAILAIAVTIQIVYYSSVYNDFESSISATFDLKEVREEVESNPNADNYKENMAYLELAEKDKTSPQYEFFHEQFKRKISLNAYKFSQWKKSTFDLLVYSVVWQLIGAIVLLKKSNSKTGYILRCIVGIGLFLVPGFLLVIMVPALEKLSKVLRILGTG